ncbi:hypothetical protein DAEQUDRAFT_724642 [Daedalea quercina L-15889]|uniref:Uncharacterized protein n=1 Tax=Daedalea quercina L-15889 TaxID=1314783 RepID=A0A165RL74_9APHY|nr:hypothetical protein DAEQUDRAFT_724642 [Daedalea quercina L-15889]
MPLQRQLTGITYHTRPRAIRKSKLEPRRRKVAIYDIGETTQQASRKAVRSHQIRILFSKSGKLTPRTECSDDNPRRIHDII